MIEALFLCLLVVVGVCGPVSLLCPSELERCHSERAPGLQHPDVVYKGGDEQVEGLDDESAWRQRRRQAKERWQTQENRDYADLQAAVYASIPACVCCCALFSLDRHVKRPHS